MLEPKTEQIIKQTVDTNPIKKREEENHLKKDQENNQNTQSDNQNILQSNEKQVKKKKSAKKEEAKYKEEKIVTQKENRKRKHHNESSPKSFYDGLDINKINMFWNVDVDSKIFNLNTIARRHYINQWIKWYDDKHCDKQRKSTNPLSISYSDKELNTKTLINKDIEELYKTIKKIAIKNKL